MEKDQILPSNFTPNGLFDPTVWRQPIWADNVQDEQLGTVEGHDDKKLTNIMLFFTLSVFSSLWLCLGDGDHKIFWVRWRKSD